MSGFQTPTFFSRQKLEFDRSFPTLSGDRLLGLKGSIFYLFIFLHSIIFFAKSSKKVRHFFVFSHRVGGWVGPAELHFQVELL